MESQSYSHLVRLPEDLQTGRLKDAKGTISFKIVVPPEYNKKARKLMKKLDKQFEEIFKNWVEELDL